jgi:hypothetical protein
MVDAKRKTPGCRLAAHQSCTWAATRRLSLSFLRRNNVSPVPPYPPTPSTRNSQEPLRCGVSAAGWVLQ